MTLLVSADIPLVARHVPEGQTKRGASVRLGRKRGQGLTTQIEAFVPIPGTPAYDIYLKEA